MEFQNSMVRGNNMQILPLLVIPFLLFIACSKGGLESHPREIVVTEEGNPAVNPPEGGGTGGTSGDDGGSGSDGGTATGGGSGSDGGTTTSGGSDGGNTAGGETGVEPDPYTIKFCNVRGVEKTKLKYDAEGRLVYEESDRSADGDVDQITTYTYDDKGTLATKTYQNPLEGEVLESTETYTNSYEEGRLTDQEVTINGAFFRSTNFLYDDRGRVQKERIDQGDPSLEFDEIILYFYNGDSSRPQMQERVDWFTETERDVMTGTSTVQVRNRAIERINYTYEGDRLVATEIDSLVAGFVDTRIVHTHDENARLIKDSYHLFMESDDGVEDGYCTYTYH